MSKIFAGFINRFFSTCIDQSIYSTLFLLPTIWICTASSISELISKTITTLALYWIPIGLLGFAYILFFQRKFGRTMGMFLAGSRIEDKEGNNLPFSLIFYRQTIGFSISYAFFFIGFLWILKNKHKQGWHDILVDSYVVKKGHGSSLIAFLFLILFFIIQTGIAYASFSNLKNSKLIEHIATLSQQIENVDTKVNEDIQPESATDTQSTTNGQEKSLETKLENTKLSQVEDLYWQGFDIWVKTKDYQKAEEYYKKALEIDPNYAPALSSYGFLLGAFHERYTEGEAMIRKAMEIDPSWAYAPYNLGLMLSIQGKYDEGIYWVQYAVDNYPNHPDHEWFKEHLEVMKSFNTGN